jgi:hypothetical protein
MSTSFQVGYNYPWPSNIVGRWLGPGDRQDKWPPDYATRWKDLPFKKEIATNLDTLRRHGVEVVRWFLLANGFNYGLPPRVSAIRSGEPFGTAQVIDFDPPDRLDPLFLSHFQQLLEIHRAAKMKLIPSLLSFEFFASYETHKTAAGGRGAIVEDARKRNTFLFTVLGEFLRVSSDERYRPWIHAWEIVNEPGWALRSITPKQTGNLPHPIWVSPNSMKAFIYLADRWIRDKNFPSTVGHRFVSDLSLMGTGSMPQIHYYSEKYGPYADPPELPESSAARAVMIGEFGAQIGKGFETNEKPAKASMGNPWDRDFPDHRDRIPSKTVYERLKLIKDRGYELALVWPDLDDKDEEMNKVDGLKLSREKLLSIQRFVKDYFPDRLPR